MSLLSMFFSFLNSCLSFTLIKGLGVFMKQKENQIHFYILWLPTTKKWLESRGLPLFINWKQTCDQQVADVKVTEHSSSHLHQNALGRDCYSKTAKVDAFSELVLLNKCCMFEYESTAPVLLAIFCACCFALFTEKLFLCYLYMYKKELCINEQIYRVRHNHISSTNQNIPPQEASQM